MQSVKLICMYISSSENIYLGSFALGRKYSVTVNNDVSRKTMSLSVDRQHNRTEYSNRKAETTVE